MELPIRVLPLGGLGEIGMNCMLLGCGERWVLVDAGVQFPDALEIGVQRKLPDVRFLARWKGKVEAVVLTHGHEDHIGALPWVLPALGDVPVFASSFTRELVRHRLAEHGMWRGDRVTVVRVGERFEAGPWEVEPVRVTHSLPDCTSLVFRCQDGVVVHTGDWKIDEQPMDGEAFDREAFERVGREGVSLLLSDSTNVRTPGRTRSETEVAEALTARIAAWKGRVVVAMFASNLHRLRGLVRAADASGRRLVFAGRSLWRYLEAAERDGRAPCDPSRVTDISAAGDLDPARTLVLSTGSQGEPLSALYRAAHGQHADLILGRGDLVLHSARVIPGNEDRAYDMFNHLARRGAEVVHGSRTPIHASGHACQDEQRELIRLLRPGHFVPVHGEYTFLRDHARLALEEGVPGATVLENGEVLGLGAGAGKAARVETARLGLEGLDLLYNDGEALGDRDEMRLSERLRVAWNGVVVVSLTLERGRDALAAADVRVETRAMWTDEGRLTDELHAVVRDAVAACRPGAPAGDVEDAVASDVRSAVRRRLGKRPEVLVVAHRGSAP